MREMKDSGVEWIGKIPKDWDVFKGKYGLKYLQKPVKQEDDVITCFRDGEVTLRKNRREDGFTMSDKEIGYQGVDVGDLVVHGMDGFAGAIGISDSRGKASPVLNVLDSSMVKKFIMYYLRSMAYGNVFTAIATGIRVRSCDLRWNKLANLPYPVPPFEEQRQIADFLDQKCSEIDALTADIQTQIETLEEYKKSVITEAVTKGLDTNVEMKDSRVEWIGKIPKGWKVGRIKNIISIITDYTANGSFADLARNVSYIDFEGFARLVRLTDLRSDLNNSDAVYVSEYSYEYLSKSKLFGNEILIANVGAYAGLFCLMPVNKGLCTLGPNMFLLRTNSKMTFKYFYYTGHSKFVEDQLLHKSQSTAQPKLNKYDVKSTYIIIPSIEEQQVITDFLDQKCSEIDQTISEKQQQLETLAEYKKSMIYEYVTGKKEVA